MANFFSRFWNTENKPEPKTEIRQEAEKPAEERAISSLPFSNWATESTSGIHISTRNALSIPTVLSGVGTVADTISTLELPVFKNSDNGGVKDYNHPLYNLLNSSPNEVQTAKAFRHAMIVDLLVHGETFCEIERNNAGGVLAIWRIEPSVMRVQWSQDGRFLRFWAGTVEIDPANIIHVLGFSENGIRGASPFVLCERQTWSNIQYSNMSLVQNQIRPICISIEQEFCKKLLTKEEQKTYYIEHVIEGLLRGSFSEQATN